MIAAEDRVLEHLEERFVRACKPAANPAACIGALSAIARLLPAPSSPIVPTAENEPRESNLESYDDHSHCLQPAHGGRADVGEGCCVIPEQISRVLPDACCFALLEVEGSSSSLQQASDAEPRSADGSPCHEEWAVVESVLSALPKLLAPFMEAIPKLCSR